MRRGLTDPYTPPKKMLISAPDLFTLFLSPPGAENGIRKRETKDVKLGDTGKHFPWQVLGLVLG